MSQPHSNIERIADAAEHASAAVHDVINEVGALPIKNSQLIRNLITVGSIVFAAFMSYMVNRIDTAYRLNDMTKEMATATIELKAQREIIFDMQMHGHADHERRLQKIENVAADRGEVHDVEKQVSQLADKIDKDHDILIRVVALMEQRVKVEK